MRDSWTVWSSLFGHLYFSSNAEDAILFFRGTNVTQQICLLVSAPWLSEHCLAIGVLPIASIGHMTGCELAIFHSTRNLQPLNIYGLQFIISFIFITIWILVFGTIRFDLIETVSEIMPIYFCCIFLSSQCFDCYAWPEAISAQSSDP